MKLLLILVLLVVAPACAAPPTPPDQADAGLVWEAWAKVRQSYPKPEDMNVDGVVGSAMAGLPGLREAPPYPFLTQVGRLRGQPPLGVPPELADLWRALTLHQKIWPHFTHAELVRGAIAGMVAGVGDPQAFYVTAEQLPQARQTLERGYAGSYQGVGAEVRPDAGYLRLFPVGGGPAQQAGLLPGDVLLAVDGRPVAGQTVTQVIAQVRGLAGAPVQLTIGRAGQPAPLEYRVTRAELLVDTVSYRVAPGDIGYLAIDQLRDNTGQQTAQALEELGRRPLDGLILDLRAIQGGSMAAALEVAGQFLPVGSLLMYEVDVAGQRKDWTAPNGEPPSYGGRTALPPLAVVVDQDTVGAAEVLAAALQDAGRASVIGVATPGRAVTYGFTPLQDGSALYLPIARWHTPSGRQLSGSGVRPDEEVPLQVQDNWFGESQLNRAYQYLDGHRPVAR
jgi:carboxyl-terminal processing protease